MQRNREELQRRDLLQGHQDEHIIVLSDADLALIYAGQGNSAYHEDASLYKCPGGVGCTSNGFNYGGTGTTGSSSTSGGH